MRLAFCTIASKNYLPFVRTLMESLDKYCPATPKFLMLVDRPDGYFDPFKEKYKVVEIESLPNIPLIKSFTFQYNVLELNTAVKPYFIEYLTEEGFEQVIYFDPDILVTYYLESLYEALKLSSIVLTPHILSPLPEDGKLPGDLEILRSGTYNLGFIGISRNKESRRFLDWWKRKLYRWCRSRPEWGVFVDQKWIDLAPALFRDVSILRDPCYNVAYWNLHERKDLTKEGEIYYLNGQPVRFVHFSGIEIENLNSVSKHQNRYTLNDLNPTYRELFEKYRAHVIRNGYFECKNWPYSFGQYKNGSAVKDHDRNIYWSILHEPYSSFSSFSDNKELTPSRAEELPMHLTAYNYLQEGILRMARRYYWLNLLRSPYNPKNWLRLFVTLLPRRLAQRIQRAWGTRYRWRVHFFSRSNVDDKTPSTTLKRSLPLKNWGVNIAAYIDTESGVGQGARNLINVVRVTGIPYVLNNVEQKWLRRGDKTFSAEVSADNPYPVNIIAVNADQVEDFASQVSDSYFNGRYSIGYWFWEVHPFPEKFQKAFSYYSEIWVGSTYVLDIISRQAPVPVIRVPFAVDFSLTPLEKYTRRYYGLEEDKFTFLYICDGASFLQRKNPIGAVKAFKIALSRLGNSCQLILKVSNPHFQPSEYEKLVELCKGIPVRLIEGYLDREEVLGLINCCDCYVSPHRAEGFGLTIAEAMYLGKPVIATGYSGNMDFMNIDNSYIIPFKLVTLEQPVGPYEAGSIWADPDIEYTAKLMIEVYEDRDTAIKKGEKAADWIRKHYSNEAVAALLKARLEVIKSYFEG